MNINTEYLPEKVYITAGFFFPFRDMLKIFFRFSDIYCLVTGLCPFLTTRLLCLWDFPGENTRTAAHFLRWGTFPTQGLNLCLLLGRQILYLWAPGKSATFDDSLLLFLLNCFFSFCGRFKYRKKNTFGIWIVKWVTWQSKTHRILQVWKINIM